ncbi:MAG: hypothetical protein ABEJ61_10235 [Haloferacaceae archaeon]
MLSRLTSSGGSATGEWHFVRAKQSATRWRRGDRTLECGKQGGGYVVTVTREGERARFQLTSGAVRLPLALAVATLYLDYGLVPQTDRDGRPFIGVDDGEPLQVFDPDSVGDDVRYVYLDDVTDVDEFPSFLPVRDDVRHAKRRMTSPSPRYARGRGE